MADYLKTALLLEEKAARLPEGSPRRRHLLLLAKAARMIGLELARYDCDFESDKGSFRKRAWVWSHLAAEMPEGMEKADLIDAAERAAVHAGLNGR